MIFLGLVGATIAGLIIDYTKKFKEVAVISLAMAILCLIWFMEVSGYTRSIVVRAITKNDVLSNTSGRSSSSMTSQ